MVVTLLQIWVGIVVFIMSVYAVRHWWFTFNRMRMRQRPFFQDLYDNDLPAVSVVVPMHDEERVAARVLDTLLAMRYPRERLEIVVVDDHSTDRTAAIVDGYAQRDSRVRVVHRKTGARGKPAALNAALGVASHEIVVVFDADYLPGEDLVRELAMGFVDPEVGAVMGRVVVLNAGVNFLTRLLSLERSGGYQVDQQARFNLDLLPQYGGTVGAFRKSVVASLDGFDTNVLAEDTDLTARMFVRGWRIAYANRAECYEEVPETWDARFRQLRRWSRGHNRALYRNLVRVVCAKGMSFWQRVDAVLMLGVYAVPPILLSGVLANMLLFFMGALSVWSATLLSFVVVGYSAFGNFAPVYEIAAAEVLDGARQRLFLLPYLFYLFLFNSWAVTSGLLDTLGDGVKRRNPLWDKTVRVAGDGP